jgi:ClpP class serine protease
MDVIKSGKLKGMGVPGTSLTEDQRAFLQSQTDRIHAQFRDAVRARRGNVADETMEGQDYYGAQAVALGLIDTCGGMEIALQLARM